MEQQKSIVVRVGIFCIVGLILLIWFSLKPTPEKIKSPYLLTAYFDEVKALEVSAPVSLMGVRIGKVTNIDFDRQSRKVRVDMLVSGDDRYKLPADSKAAIYYKSILGQYYVHIEYGQAKEFLKPGDQIATKEMPDINTIIETAGDISKDARELLSSLDKNQKRVAEKIIAMIDENQENLSKATESFAEFSPKLNKLSDELTAVINDLRNGEGTLAKLLNDDEMYTSLSNMIDSVNTITQDIRSGNGTLSKLLYDESLHRELNTTLESIREAAENTKAFLNKQQDRISNIMETLDRAIPKVEKGIDNFTEISEKINQGKGSLGKLINDPSLYDDAQRTLNQIEQTFKEGEEQGLMRTFATILFTSLM